ncbi:MAG: ureidoglycolate hydrolase [Gammaproteobacteria bacterium]|nr:ureidoglycolate hydrolase [Gammaproteobacteria bacterium]
MTGVPIITAEPLHADSFSEFGEVIHRPPEGVREFFNDRLENNRADARADLSLATIKPVDKLPLHATVMERHPFSSQTFLPLKASRYFVVVAPDNDEGGPDLARVRAFVAEGNQGVTYRCGIWHHGMTVLDESAVMAVLMWCDGSSADEEFLDIDTPFDVVLPTDTETRLERMDS